jgi:release factor glutamine methyltransferase
MAYLVKRRAAGEPLAYITGHQGFFGLDLAVDQRVLVPRPDTETLVEWALALLPRPLPAGNREGLLDLGTGSGAVALAIKHQRPDVQVTAADASAGALAVARANAERLQLNVRFRQGSWLQGIDQRFQVIVSNPPYIAAHDPHLDALGFEPLVALVGGADGLDHLRQIIAQAPRHLLPGGWLLLEHGADQASAVRRALEQSRFEQVQSRRDLAGLERCSGGCTAVATDCLR